MNKNSSILISLMLLLLLGCKIDNQKSIEITEIVLSTKHSGEPNLTTGTDGDLYLSWVEYANDSLDVLLFSKFENDKWSTPTKIAEGHDWFVNWADFPSLISVDRSRLTAHWLQKSAHGTYDYDVRISQSKDGGVSWSPSFIPHTDGINAEHGFVSMLPTPDGKTFAVWLDGRNTKKEEDNAMTLRSAVIDIDGNISNSVELDHRVCDCCQTGSTWTDRGPIVVYRDRSEDELRDIGIVRKVDGKWTSPKLLFDDNWKIAGCPVNGPSIDSKDNVVIVAWYTMSEDIPKVMASISNDYGATFNDPIIIDNESPLGRVDAIIHNNKALITWMSGAKDEADINLVIIDFDGKVTNLNKIGSNTASRSSGFPRMESFNKDIVLAWTDAMDSISIVKTFKISLDHE